MVKIRQFNQSIIVSVLLIISTFLTIAYFITDNQIETIKKSQYTNISYNIKSKLNHYIDDKKQLSTFIALTLTQNSTIIKALKNNNKNLIDIEYLTNIINKQSSYNTVWYQILDKEGNSFYRSWTNKTGDSLLKVRPEVAKMIKKPQIISTISTGKFAMTFKSMVPIFDENKNYLGSFEVVSHFDSIQTKLLKENGVFSIYIVDKEYKQ
jgi:sensor histidine kinase regulating citrate/malate metabolism